MYCIYMTIVKFTFDWVRLTASLTSCKSAHKVRNDYRRHTKMNKTCTATQVVLNNIMIMAHMATTKKVAIANVRDTVYYIQSLVH